MKDLALTAPAHSGGVSRKPAKSALWRYSVSLFFVAVALLLTLLLQHLFPYPFLFLFFGAVMASAWFGGMAAGFFAVFISTLAVDYFFVPPFHSFAINATAETYFVAFVVCALVASWVSSAKKQSEEALIEARDQLEIRVADRTAELEKSNIELREREHQLRLLTEVIPQQIWSSSSEGSVDYCNHRLLDYVGRSMEQMRGDGFMEVIHAEDRESFRRLWREALAAGKPFEGEWRVRGADGEYRRFFTRGVPLQDREQKTLRWYGTNTDIEERHQAEQALMKTQAELAYLSRALSMGELTASIAHEINQPLAAVVAHGHACAGWLAADPPNLEKARQTTERIIQDGTRAGAVLGRIRALFKKEPPAKEWLDMNEVIQELVVFLRDEAERRAIALQMKLASGLPKVNVDRVQLQQVVLNLIMNSMDALAGTRSRVKELWISSKKENTREIKILVEDNGIGLNPETVEKIFEPFFTTKAQGIGMGLTISRSIVESHGGKLWAGPRLSGGAVFQFTIPIEAQASDA